MCEDVAYYINCTYKKDEIEFAFIMGYGASYIKAGTRERLIRQKHKNA